MDSNPTSWSVASGCAAAVRGAAFSVAAHGIPTSPAAPPLACFATASAVAYAAAAAGSPSGSRGRHFLYGAWHHTAQGVCFHLELWKGHLLLGCLASSDCVCKEAVSRVQRRQHS
jgi:hypothetical protein